MALIACNCGACTVLKEATKYNKLARMITITNGRDTIRATRLTKPEQHTTEPIPSH